ncbi:12053_t:CDS:2 [Funneliformis caledonium]|uniref:12053_t:CDS:1 n=1 Tax=Funneliformis caledonium TaxID=1117310 RepID=A0A9N8WP96_9GLOM|nr:12053_t:CDS:2 [Funneliformis caledonium]
MEEMKDDSNPIRKKLRNTPNEDSQDSQEKVASITISDISNYYYLNCDKFLKFKSRRSHDKKPILQSMKGRTLRGASLQRGRNFEIEVENHLRSLHKDNFIKRKLSHDETINLLREAKCGQIFCQMLFNVHEEFYKKFNIKNIIEIRQFKPDFIIVKEEGGKKKLLIYDAKSSKCIQDNHKLQVALYAYLLGFIVQDIPELTISYTGGIYLPPLKLQEFSIDPLLPKVELLFREKLPRIIKTPKLPWHYNDRCKSCQFVNTCRNEAKGTIAAIPYLSLEEAVKLKKLIQVRDDADADIEDLNDYLSNIDVYDERAKTDYNVVKNIIKYDEKLKNSPYLNVKPRQAQFVGVPTKDFPQRSDHNLLITMSLDNVSLKPFGWGICLYTSYKETKHQFRESESISINDDPHKEFISLMDKFTTVLEKCLEYLEKDKLRVCAFVYYEREKEFIQNSLLEIMSNESSSTDLSAIKRKVERCFFSLFKNKNDDGHITEFPRMIVLEQVIIRSVAIHVPGFYRFDDIWEQLMKPILNDQELLNSLDQTNKAHLLRTDFGYAVIKAYYELLQEYTCDNLINYFDCE